MSSVADRVKRARYLVLPCLVALAAGPVACTRDASAALRFHAKDISGVLPTLRFQLTTGSGRTLTAADLRGKTTLLYFGYTDCPDACPMTMMYVAQALKRLGSQAADVRALFVSVDPRRDTPAVLRRYAASFGPEVIGLTGTEEQLTAVTKRYRVAFRRDTPDRNGNYAVYHSSAVFVFDRQGEARLLATPSGPDNGLAEDLRTLIAQPPQ